MSGIIQISYLFLYNFEIPNKNEGINMKKSIILFLFAAISLLSLQETNAQSIKIGIGGGLSSVQSPTYYTDNAGFSSEYHIGLKGMLSIPVFPITPIGFIEYHFFRGQTPEGADTKQNILSIGVGGQMELLPGPLSPYIGLDLEFNNLGEITGLPTGSSVSRMGLGVGAGVMLTLLPIDFDVSLKYQMLNLFGKESGEENIGIINLNAAIFF